MTRLEQGGGSAWILSDSKAGHLAMTTGVAAAMGLETRIIELAPSRVLRWMAPRGPVPADAEAIMPKNHGKWPDYAFAAGRLTIPYLRALRRRAAGRTFTVAFMDPRVNDAADLIWLPEHDARRGKDVITTVTSPHGFSHERLAALRAQMHEQIAALPMPRVAVLIGGPGAGFSFSPASTQRLADALGALAGLGASFLITPSRRTPARLLSAVVTATSQAPRIVWDGTGDNPYPHFLACADNFVVTADSVNMTGEACATGRPVYVFTPEGGRAKFHAFHASLRETGATRPLPEHPADLASWHYTPIDAARQIAEAIAVRAKARLMA